MVSARNSHGLPTPHGKARFARNARRHGLSLPIAADATLAPEISVLAAEIAGEGGAMRAAPPPRISRKRRSTSSASAECGSP